MPGYQSDEDVHQDFTPEQRRVLEDVYQRISEDDRWPTFAELDYAADRHGVEDPLSVIGSLSSTYLQGLGESGAPALTQELSLSLTGLAAAAGWNDVARQDLELFAKSVQAAVAISDAVTPPNVARFDALSFLMPLFPSNPHVSVVIRLGRIWGAAGATLWNGLSGVGTVEWAAELNQQNLRAYRPVRDVSSLLEVERERLAGLAQERARLSAAIGSTSHPPSLRPAEDGPQWVELLPDGFREAVAHRVANHGADAINAGWIELAELIHRKVGIDLDGEDLVNHAFGGNAPRLRLAHDTKTGNNLHHGYTDLMRGLARMRNAQSHRGRPAVTELHVAATIMAMGECYLTVSRVDDLAGT
jgi:hypothetical protein